MNQNTPFVPSPMTAIVLITAVAMVLISFPKGFYFKTKSGNEFDSRQDKD
jgi:hypothetical protein